MENTSFAEITDVSGKVHLLKKENEKAGVKALKQSIIAETFNKDSNVTLHTAVNGEIQKADSTLFEFSKNYFSLRTLFQPVWTSAMSGLKWGVILGIILKLLDSAWLLATVNPILAFFFVVGIATLFIPKAGKWIAMAIIFFMVKYGGGFGIFAMILTATLTGAILGALPGMLIGSIMGYVRSLFARNVTRCEPKLLFLKAVLLPLLGACGIIATYIFVIMPWLVNVLS